MWATLPEIKLMMVYV